MGIERPGLLQMSRLHPSSELLVPSRFLLDDVEHMISVAITDSEAGHNVYCEGRTVREGLRGNERGKLTDTAAVFALIIDSDPDKGMGWIPTPTTRPSMTVETSPGNSQFWHFLREAISPELAQKLGERIRRAINSDHDTGNPVQPYRVAGTINYPTPKKIARGRVTVPTRLVEFDPEALWTPEEIVAAFPLPEGGGGGGGTADEANVPDETLRVIRDGVPQGERSEAFWNVILLLNQSGWSIDAVVALLEKYPDGIAAKYCDRLRREVERIWNKLGNGQPPLVTVFDPWQRYIVPAFPLDVVPPMVQDYVKSQAAIIGCDISGLAMCVLGAFSGALHHEFALKMQRYGKWFACPRLWVLFVTDPSQRKTPMFKAATRPLVEHEVYVRQKYQRELREYEEVKERAGGKKAEIGLSEPKPPPRYVVWNTTTEKCAELLARSPKGITVLSDEISGWLGSMEKYNKNAGADRAFWLIAYDGGPHGYDRIGRGEIFIENLSISLLGCIQPERLAEMQGLTSDGLLQRFLPIMMGPPSFNQDRPCDDDDYNKLIRELILAKPEHLVMDDAALAVMTDLRRHLFDIEQTSAGLAAGFQTWVGKLHGIAGSLALILHMAHDPQNGATYAVERHTVENVRRLMLDFILRHGYEFYQQGGGSEQLRRIASWILTSGTQRLVSSDITKNVADCRGLSLREIQERVSPLVAAGWLNPVEERNPLCRAWTVTPQVHAQLAERAKTEKARKTALAALIKGQP
jgi:hypothetical protein